MAPKKKSSSGEKCYICKKGFSDENQCNTHVNEEHGPRFDCQCAHCTGKRRHESAKLVEERKLKDSDNKDAKLYKCIVCDYQVFLLCKCLSHIQTSHNTVSLQKQFECMKCNVGFERCLELHNHILQEHPNAQRIARCGFAHCKKCFSNATMLQAHLKQNHKVTKPFDLLNSLKSGSSTSASTSSSKNSSSSSRNSASSSRSSASSSKTSDTSGFTSAWTEPDPPSPPPPETVPSTTKEKYDPDLTCKMCNKTHKSQTSYNNHMGSGLEEKYKSSKPAAKKRRRDDDTSSSGSDAESEDSDWAPSNSKSKRTANRPTRASQKQPSKVNIPQVKARHPSAGSDTSVPNNEPGPEPPTTPRDSTPPNLMHKQSPPTPQNQQYQQNLPNLPQQPTPPTPQHKQGNHANCEDCLACKAQANKTAPIPPPIRIKQEPLDPSDPPPAMPVISNVYSTHPMTHPGIHQPMQPLTNGYSDYTKASTSGYTPSTASTAAYSGDDNERPPSVGSNYSSATESRHNMMSGSSPTSGWNANGGLHGGPAHTKGELCSGCLAQKPNQNKCEHCGIIFLEPTMHMIHMLWHGEKHPFQCHTCGVVCTDKYSFTTHIFKAEHLK